ncbi:hypothetical protein JCM30566_19610 [Marinitoga arctica]
MKYLGNIYSSMEPDASACGIKGCPADACALNACLAKGCVGNACGIEFCPADGCIPVDGCFIDIFSN